MKYLTVLIAFAFLLTLLPLRGDAQSQVLKLTDIRTGRTEFVKSGAIITYQTKGDSSIHEGKLGKLAPATIEIDGNAVPLAEVHILGASSKGRMIAGEVTEGIGHGLTIAGRVVTWVGVEVFAFGDGYGWVIGGTVAIAGGVLWGTGLIIKTVLSPVLYTLRDAEVSHNLEAEVVLKDKQLVYPDDIYD